MAWARLPRKPPKSRARGSPVSLDARRCPNGGQRFRPDKAVIRRTSVNMVGVGDGIAVTNSPSYGVPDEQKERPWANAFSYWRLC